jgi:MFS family permease
MSIKKFFAPFFANHLARQLHELYSATTILDFGIALVSIFEPIYLYQNGFSLPQIIIFFVAPYVIYFFLLPLGGKFARTRGYEHSIFLGTPFLILYYISLYSVPKLPIFLPLAVISLALFKTFYWPAYRAMLARYTRNAESGRALSGLGALSIIASIAGPILGGAILTWFGFATLFVIAAAFILVSNVPMLVTPEKFEPHDLSYRDAFRRLFRPEFFRSLVSHLGYGEEFIYQFIWPIFILLIIPSYFNIGAMVTVASVVMLIATMVVGRVTDEHSRRATVRVGTLFTALAWVSKLLVTTPFGVLWNQSLYLVARITIGIPFVSQDSENAREYSVMKSSVFFEMSIVLGKVLTGLIALAIISLFTPGWYPLFIFGALLTLLYGWNRKSFDLGQKT